MSRRTHPRRCGALVLTFSALTLWSAPLVAAQPEPGFVSCRGGESSGCTERRYTLAARVRPLLFWIGKDNVGEARLTWLGREAGEQGYGLLIGSDPRRAPRQINRWGYVSELEDHGAVQVFGLMTQADEESLEQAKAATGNVPGGTQVYKIIHASVGSDWARSAVQGMALSDQLTFRDVETVLAQVKAPSNAAEIPVPRGTQPGFLFAMTSLLRENVEAVDRGGVPTGGSRSYVFGKKLYKVAVRQSRLLKQATIKGRQFEKVIETEFEARLATGSKGDRFKVLYGTGGALRGVPIRIVYRPNFWFEAEAVLADEAGR